MYAEELLLRLLMLDQSWSIGQVDIDLPSNRLDITVHFGRNKKKWFFWQSATPASEGHITLRHLPIWRMRTFLHVPDSDTIDSDKSWMPPYSKFTHEMEQSVVDALTHCQSIRGAAKVMGLTATEVRGICERTDADVGADTTKVRELPLPNTDDVARQPVAMQSFDLDLSYDSSRIPEETHPSWQQLIDGKVQLVSSAVGLQMLLQRVRQAMVNNPTETERLSGIRLVRQFFVKNQSVHGKDIQLLFGDDSSTVTSSPSAGVSKLANSSHPQWRKIVDGEIRLETNNVSLQMMLEQVRHSIARNLSESNYSAGITLLSQFFEKHQSRLGAELAQLGLASVIPGHDVSPSVAAMGLPTDMDLVWRRIIEGELTIQTDAVSLQMMLERVRQSIVRNPSEQTRMAGIRILRQFFLKHQSQLSGELQQLYAGAECAPGMATLSALAQIPIESSPVWQKLIDGDLQIQTDAVALKMMLEGVRISIQNNPSEAKKKAGVKMLRQYFIKYQRIHTTEVNQLIAA